MIKGLDLSRNYYENVIYPMLQRTVPDDLNRIAIGLVGEGSECFGFDDEISRDHDWGAKVCLWLEVGDYERIGRILMQKIAELPATYKDYPVCWIPGRNGVLEIGAFFRKYLDTDGPLQTVGQWLHVPENHLAVASNGAVFYDPLGKFTAIWEDLRLGYPEDIRLKKIAAKCMQIGQAGQYNYRRLEQRGDRVASTLALNEFIQAVISVTYLLNNQYTPFYKWMFHGMRRLPRMGPEIGDHIEQLLISTHKVLEIEEICEQLIAEFVRQGITDCNDCYMVAQGESIHQHIQNEALRGTNPWVA